MISERIAKYMKEEFPDQCGLGWGQSLTSGCGTMAVFWNPEYPGINFQIWDDENERLKGQLSLTVLGFSGQVLCDKLSLPNDHLYTQMCQLETIQNRLPMYENINDFYHEVVGAHMMKKRAARKKARDEARAKTALDNSNSSGKME